MENYQFKVALIGNPNCGKTSVFNLLTGLNHKTGNFPGVTVEQKSSSIKINDQWITISDFPGTYSIHATTLDEIIVSQVLSNPQDKNFPDLVLYVASADQMERHLLLLSQIMDLKIPTVLLVNRIDLREDLNFLVDLEQSLKIPVLGVSARTKVGKEEILEIIGQKLLAFNEGNLQNTEFNKDQVWTLNGVQFEEYRSLLKYKLSSNEDISRSVIVQFEVEETLHRFGKLDTMLQSIGSDQRKSKRATRSLDIDQWLTHPLWGSLIFLGILFFIFQLLFYWSEWPMNQLESIFNWSIHLIQNQFGDNFLVDFIANGLLPGISGILVFVPQIALLFLFLSILEESGYMSRVVYLTDFVMRKFGMNGRSIIALISSSACAIPAIMGTRTINNTKERLITIMVSPLISCSARLPVYTLLISFVIPSGIVLGFINTRGLVFFGIYLVGVIVALVLAILLKLLVKSKEPQMLMIELPDYQMPLMRNVFINVWEKVKSFVLEAGKIILLISIIIWGLTSYSPAYKDDHSTTHSSGWIQQQPDLNKSFAGILGQKIEPVIEPLGFDWKIGISLITSFAAREVFVSTMATIYGSESDEPSDRLTQILSEQVNPNTGKKVFNLASSASLIVFYMFAMQCMSTIAVVRKETGTWKWPLFQLVLFTLMAYFSSFMIFQFLNG